MIRESWGMKMSSLSLVDNQKYFIDTGGQGEDMDETKSSSKEKLLEDLEWWVKNIEDIFGNMVEAIGKFKEFYEESMERMEA